ncbi:hypothetical protein [Mycobacterium sp. 155]|uniref:hypothetical protein n=1 Tax=Mycobacterium sp. 155 TaxID=1157943 RepID=UPI0003783CF3|nr:hypothetical protein [Mycobacterium sp. 155]
MTELTDPRAALAEHASLIDYLVGLAGLGRLVRTLTAGGAGNAGEAGGGAPGEPDDFVHVLLGLAALGARVEHLAPPVPVGPPGAAPDSSASWLR